jgi:hypothetical protein
VRLVKFILRNAMVLGENFIIYESICHSVTKFQHSNSFCIFVVILLQDTTHG